MVNKNYKRGADYERRIVKSARDRGLIAFRSAGSHSPIDVIIIDSKLKLIRLIQCKTGKSYSTAFKQRLEEQYSFLNSAFLVNFEVL